MFATYAPLTLKLLEPAATGQRRISGIASTKTRDRQGDIIESLGMSFTNPVTLLVGHDQGKPVGKAWLSARPESITFEATLHDPNKLPPGPLRSEIEQAYAACREGIYTAVSIAIASARAIIEPLREGGLHFKSGEIVELSLVTVPANSEAGIHSVKSLDPRYLAARQFSGGNRMTIPEQIEALETRHANADTRLQAILELAAKENRTCTPDESTEYDAVDAERKRLAVDIARWKERELVNKSLAVSPGSPPPEAPRSTVLPFQPTITVKSTLQPAARFVRLAMAKMYGKGDTEKSLQYARQFKDTPEVEAIIKAAVAVGTTTDATWAGPLVPTLQNVTAEFIALLRPATLLGRIPGIVTVPFNVRVPAQTGGGTYGWVGEGLSKPVTKLAFAAVTLAMHKAAGIIVFTEELARVSSPSAEEMVRNDMINGIAAFLDSQFVDPAVAEVAGVNPASITNGLTPIVSTDNILADLTAIFTALAAANIDPAGGTLLMSPGNAFALATTTASGLFVFPNITMQGGTLVGINVVTSSVLGTNVVFIARNSVFVADEGGIQIDVSREASVQMDSAPLTPPAPLVSLWQQNFIGLRADRFISWKRARTAGVQLVTGAGYTAPALMTTQQSA
jgi:HK97 family phage major capsid protein